MLTPEDITYLREWAKNGNEPRHEPTISLKVKMVCRPGPVGYYSLLPEVGLTIVALADALEQACATAETYGATGSATQEEWAISDLETMRRNRKGLIDAE